MNNFLVSIVVPCYNEEENIAVLVSRIVKSLSGYFYEIILVNDGSQDATQMEIELASKLFPEIRYLNFSRNFGHQAALKAGIDHAHGDCIITIDADLQKPPEHIPEMILLWTKGFDIVTAICQNEGQPSLFKKWTSMGYYKVLTWLADHPIVAKGADFRLMDKKVARIISSIQSQNLYLRGIFSWMGFSQTTSYYTESQRNAGKTKYSLVKMLNLASNGITSFSIKPLRMALAIGIFFAFLAFGYGIYAISMVFLGLTVPGWASLVASVVFLSGVQLIVLGVIGEYVGKIYRELSMRPTYLISNSNFESGKTRPDSKRFSHQKERRPAMT